MKRPGLISSDCYDHIFVKRAGKILHIQQVRREIRRRLAPKPCLWVTDEIHPLVALESAVHFAFRLSIMMLKTWSTPFCSSQSDESVLVVIGTSHRDIIAHRCLDSLKQTPHLYSSDPWTFQKCSKHLEWPFSSPYTNRQNKNSKHSSHHQPPGLTITPFLISLELDFRSEVLWKAGSWIPAYMEFDF